MREGGLREPWRRGGLPEEMDNNLEVADVGLVFFEVDHPRNLNKHNNEDRRRAKLFVDRKPQELVRRQDTHSAQTPGYR